MITNLKCNLPLLALGFMFALAPLKQAHINVALEYTIICLENLEFHQVSDLV